MSVLRYFAKNSFIRIGTYLTGVVAAFFVTPHIVGSLGSSGYGIWALISSLASYYSLLGWGQIPTVSKKVAEAHAQGNVDAVNGIYAASSLLGAISCSLVLLTSFGLAQLAPFFQPETIELSTIVLCLCLFSTSIAIQLLLRAAHGLLAGSMRWTFIAIVALCRIVCSSAMALVFLSPQLSASDNLVRMAIITSVVTIAEPVVFTITAWTKLGTRFRFSCLQWNRVVDVFKFGTSIVLTEFGGFLEKRSLIYIVAIFVSTAQVAIFSIVNQFISYMTDLTASAFGIMNPYFSTLHAKNERSACQNSLLDTLFLSYAVSGLIGLALVFYGSLFTLRWLGSDFESISHLLVPMALAAILGCGSSPITGFLQGLGQQRLSGKLSLLQGGAVTLLCFPAVFLFGMAGAGWMVFGVSLVFYLGIIPYYVSIVAQIDKKRLYCSLALMLLPQIIIQAGYYFAIQDYLEPKYGILFMAGCGQGLIALCVLMSVLCCTRTLRRFYPQTTATAKDLS